MADRTRSSSRTPIPAATARDGIEELAMTDDELLVDERTALDGFFDAVNLRRFRSTVWLLAAILAVYAIVLFATGAPTRGAVAGIALIADLFFLRQHRSGVIAGNVRQTVAAVLIGHLVILQLFHGTANGGLAVWFTAVPLLASRFRLASGETLALFGSLYAVVAVRLVGESLVTRQPMPIVSLVLYGLFVMVVGVSSWALSRRREAGFLARFEHESARHRDRLRMKQELEYAREIQLSMLPRRAPDVRWLDLAALSLPATEVGGDYYDYFQLDPERLAVVVGDVTGHGVASGLVLSGVRSSLNLLHDDMERPSAVLERVNLMLKRTSAPRMHMTLAVALLDRRKGAAVVATAGHPPALIRRRTGTVVEVGAGSFPLGAMADASYTENRVGIAAGELLLLYSDGVVETMSPAGEQFGWRRLRGILEAADHGLSAARVRDLILRELWEFKQDAAQVDDVTMVVGRVRSLDPE